MASEDKMHYAIMADYSGEDDDFNAGCSDSDYEPDIDYQSSGNHYTLLNGKDIQRRQEDDVTEVSAVLSIHRESARLLLRHYNWNVDTVHENWFADEENVRKAVGLLDKPMAPGAKRFTCGICFDEYHLQMICAACCGHPFCKECWQGYITTSIADGPACLSLRCPQPSCHAAIDKDMVDVLISDDEHRKKYYQFMVRSYVENNPMIKWCPAPDCEWAVKFVDEGGNYDVICSCSYEFCWNCRDGAHRPVDCDTVAKWMLKRTSEEESTKWIWAYTKPCPNCKKPIEKNDGCMHMTCKCGQEFCWLCLGRWSDHRNCNRYVEDEQTRKKEEARESLERYTHYYERWAANQSSREKAIKDLKDMEKVQIVNLSEIQNQPETQLKFILDAWVQIIECRRVLKWTYAYGYYLSENEKAKKALFEYLQGQAEAGLERLHRCAEMELSVFFQGEKLSEEFIKYRVKLTSLTSVTKNYFENLVRALENDLADVPESSSSGSKEHVSETGSGGKESVADGFGTGDGKDYDVYVDSDGEHYYLSDGSS